MGLFDGVLGGIVGGGMVSVVNTILEKHGGVQGVINEFERNGLGPTVQSWVGSGPNQAITPDQLHSVLGPELLQRLSEKTGVPVPELTQKLAQILPSAIDAMTPNGQVPSR
ncbi:MAG TPA: YidB family protein [Vicinamibacterales bacterium]